MSKQFPADQSHRAASGCVTSSVPWTRELDWLAPVTLIVGVQVVLWLIAYLAAYAYPPMFRTYGKLAYSFFILVAGARLAMLTIELARAGEPNPIHRTFEIIRANSGRILATVIGIQIFAMGSSAFSALKGAMARVVPFWLDAPLASAERFVLGSHPWELSHALLGWATPAIDRAYATFMLAQMIALCCLLMAKPSEKKARALVTLALSWLVLGVGGAYLWSSAGPIFYDRVFGGDTFAELSAALQHTAPIAVKTADMLWASHASDFAMVANGISAMPSMHVGLTFWIVLLVRRTPFAPLAWTYYAVIWIGSVHLGWHYASDGLVGSIGVLVLWKLAPKLISDVTNLSARTRLWVRKAQPR